MKYKLICLVTVVLMVVFAFVFQGVETPTARYHQHLEEPGYVACETHGDEVFCSHLPLVLIDTGGQTIPGENALQVDKYGESLYSMAEDGEETINVSVSVIDNAEGNNHLTDEPDFTSITQFRIRGHASRTFEKSPYLLKFVDEQGLNRDIPVMGMDAHNKWVLHGPYLDKSLIRNYISYNWAGEIMEYAPNVRYCEVFLDGEYRGLYLMTETIDNGDNCRLKLSATEKNQKTVGYLLRIDRPTEAEENSITEIYTYAERMMHLQEDLTIRYPGDQTLTKELAQSITAEFSAFEKSLYSFDYLSRKDGYRKYIDVDNFVDYFLINEFLGNTDAGQYSTYIYKDMNLKYKLCVWDFNNACDNFPDDQTPWNSYVMLDRMMFSMLFKDKDFVQRVLDRYDELRKGVLNEDQMFQYINDTVDFLGPAIDRNTERWQESMEESAVLLPKERNDHSQREAIARIRSFLRNRGTWLDENIHALQQHSSESKTKAYKQEYNY